MGDVVALGVEAGRAEEAQVAQESWMRYCRRIADERKELVLKSLPDNIPLKLMLSLLIDAERDHAKAEWIAVGK